MKKILTFIVSILFIFSICSCSKSDKKKEYETYEVKSNYISFSGYIDSKSYKSYMISDGIILSVNNGDIVTKGQELYKINNDNNAETIKNNNKISNMEQDIASCDDKIKKLTNNSNEIAKKIESCEDLALIEEYKIKKSDLDNSIEEMKKLKLDFERGLRDLKVDIQYETKNETADFDGQVIINDGMLELYSLSYEVVYNATQQQVSSFEKEKQYKIEMNDEEIGAATLKYIIPNDDLSNKGVSSYYKVVFDINTDKSLLRNNMVNIIDNSNEILVPEDYVQERDGELFVKKNGEEIRVDLEKEKSSYRVIKGIDNGDTLESYMEK